MSRYALVVDLDRCIGCKACEVACKMEHDLPLGVRWNRTLVCGPFGEYPDLTMWYLPVQCQQCADAPCVGVCPVGASYRDPETDVVKIDADTCIGCQLCLDACPYNVRSYNPAAGVVTKCTMCEELTAEGKLPACVAACCGDARYWGDLDDPESDAAQALASKPDAHHHLQDEGNGPRTVYMLSAKYGEWQGALHGHNTNANGMNGVRFTDE